MAALDAVLDALREVGLPVFAAVTTTIAAFLPLMLLPGIVGKFMFIIPFVVSVGLVISLVEAFWMLPAHVSALGHRAIRRSRTQALRVRWTHWIRVKYTRLLIHVMRYPARYLGLALALFLGAGGAIGAGWVKFQFFAFDPVRLFYVNVLMPPDMPLEETLRQTLAVEERVRAGLRYVLGTFSDEGHVYAERQALIDKAAELLEVAAELGQTELDYLVRSEDNGDTWESIHVMDTEIDPFDLPSNSDDR